MVLVVLGGITALVLPRIDVNPGDPFCQLALPLYDIDGVTVTAKDLTGDGPGPCDVREGGDLPLVDYDCSVTYPSGWSGPTLDEIEPADVDGNCGTTGPGATLADALVVASALGAILLLRRMGQHDDAEEATPVTSD